MLCNNEFHFFIYSGGQIRRSSSILNDIDKNNNYMDEEVPSEG